MQGSNIQCAGLVGNIGFRINDFQITLEAGNPLRITLNDGADLVNRPEKDIGQQNKSNEFPDRKLSLNEEPGTADHHDDGNQTGHHEGLNAGGEQTADDQIFAHFKKLVRRMHEDGNQPAAAGAAGMEPPRSLSFFQKWCGYDIFLVINLHYSGAGSDIDDQAHCIL